MMIRRVEEMECARNVSVYVITDIEDNRIVGKIIAERKPKTGKLYLNFFDYISGNVYFRGVTFTGGNAINIAMRGLCFKGIVLTENFRDVFYRHGYHVIQIMGMW